MLKCIQTSSVQREMLHFVVLFNLIFLVGRFVKGSSGEDSDFGAGLISSLRNDANLDLSADEEYEDLRAELLAYHTALASLTASQTRKSMLTTPCWKLGGICINYKLCTGFRFLTEVPGCKSKLNVCCFAWNEYRVRDMRDHGIGNVAFPWSLKQEFGGKGVIDVSTNRPKASRRPPSGKKNKPGKGADKRKLLHAPKDENENIDVLPSADIKEPMYEEDAPFDEIPNESDNEKGNIIIVRDNK